MNILFTCGGTAGHINPAVALARMFRERDGAGILFVGADGGMETRLVPKEGFDLKTVTITSFHRSLRLSSLTHNIKTLHNMTRSGRQAADILTEFRPDLVVGTGGYASYPVVHAAARRGIPTAVHESNAVPGLTTKTLSRVADVVMVGFAESKSYYEHPEKVAVTGTPVRGDFFRFTRLEARRELGLEDDRPLLLSYWGSLGAEDMDDCMVDFIRAERAAGVPFLHIHGAGRDFGRLEKALKEKGSADPRPGIEIREYIYDMPLVMAAADLVLCRAGASTISELTALGTPALMVPSPYVTNNHQEKNARALEEHGGAVVLTEEACSGQALFQAACGILHDPSRLRSMEAGHSKVTRISLCP